jgi:hypothetical protein
MMVRPLYPPRRPGKKASEADEPLWRNPYLLASGIGVALLVGIFFYHFLGGSNTVDPTAPAGPAGQGRDRRGFFSFLQSAIPWKTKPTDLLAEDEVAGIGIPSATRSIFATAKPENYREQRRIMAFQKIEGARRLGEERQQAAADRRKHLETPTAHALRDAMESLETADNLGIMRLEGLLQEKLLSRGGNREDLDTLIFAFQNLGQVYERKNMKEKAREAYLSAFKLMKENAPDDQGRGWDEAIGQIESLPVTSRGN